MESPPEHHEVPEKKLDTDEDQEQRFREPASFGMSVAGTVAAFVAGFGILPSSTSAEKVLILITVIGASGAIIFGIGAWRSGRRFIIMAISAGLAFMCLAALSVVAQTASSAHGTASPPSSDSSQPANGTPTSSPGATGPTAPDGYVLKYSKQQFTMPGDSCQSGFPDVLFAGQGPTVTAPDSSALGSFDMELNCSSMDIEFNGQASLVSGNPNANACDTAINRNPLGGSEFHSPS
jgi:hypothetical protein